MSMNLNLTKLAAAIDCSVARALPTLKFTNCRIRTLTQP